MVWSLPLEFVCILPAQMPACTSVILSSSLPSPLDPCAQWTLPPEDPLEPYLPQHFIPFITTRCDDLIPVPPLGHHHQV